MRADPLARTLVALKSKHLSADQALAQVERDRRQLTDTISAERARLDAPVDSGPLDPRQSALLREMAWATKLRIEARLNQLSEQLNSFDRDQRAPAQERVKAASVRVQSVELVMERRAEEDKLKARRQEAKDMDEAASTRWMRDHG